MKPLVIELRDQQTAFHPGDEIRGAAYWKLEQAPKSVEVRLFWQTHGRGTEELAVVDKFSFADPKPEEARPFEFRAPESPYSFSGKLITLVWGLELIAEPGSHSASVELIISPTAAAIQVGEK